VFTVGGDDESRNDTMNRTFASGMGRLRSPDMESQERLMGRPQHKVTRQKYDSKDLQCRLEKSNYIQTSEDKF